MPCLQASCDPALFVLQALAGKSVAEPEHAQPSVDWLRRNLEAVRTSSLPKDLELNEKGEHLSHPSFCDGNSFVQLESLSADPRTPT